MQIIGVRFRTAGKIFYFLPGSEPVSRGTHVIVETPRGIEYGTVAFGPKEMSEDDVPQPVRPILRTATAEDDQQEADNRAKEVQAKAIAKMKIAEHGLEMKLVAVEYTFDGRRITFYFTADGRVDFRELVRDLASIFHTRIELRQIGVRDETKILGGVGMCGRTLCCANWLSDFVPVSIKMAKQQNLSLNPVKISGICGRLMCCLQNEESTYEYLESRLPQIGAKVTAEDGTRGTVVEVSVLKQTVKVQRETENDSDDREITEYKVDQLKFEQKRRPGQAPGDEARRRAAEMNDNPDIAVQPREEHAAGTSDGDSGQADPVNPANPADTGDSAAAEKAAGSGNDAGTGEVSAESAAALVPIPAVVEQQVGSSADSGEPGVRVTEKTEYHVSAEKVDSQGLVSQVTAAVQSASGIAPDGTEVSQVSASVSVTRKRSDNRGERGSRYQGRSAGTAERQPGRFSDRYSGETNGGPGRSDYGRKDYRRSGTGDQGGRNRGQERTGRFQGHDRMERQDRPEWQSGQNFQRSGGRSSQNRDRYPKDAQRPQGQTRYDRNRKYNPGGRNAGNTAGGVNSGGRTAGGNDGSGYSGGRTARGSYPGSGSGGRTSGGNYSGGRYGGSRYGGVNRGPGANRSYGGYSRNSGYSGGSGGISSRGASGGSDSGSDSAGGNISGGGNRADGKNSGNEENA